LRFMPSELNEDWDITSTNQWGENFLSLDAEAQINYVDAP
jgi:ribosome biogenesis protein Tsr3